MILLFKQMINVLRDIQPFLLPAYYFVFKEILRIHESISKIFYKLSKELSFLLEIIITVVLYRLNEWLNNYIDKKLLCQLKNNKKTGSFWNGGLEMKIQEFF